MSFSQYVAHSSIDKTRALTRISLLAKPALCASENGIYNDQTSYSVGFDVFVVSKWNFLLYNCRSLILIKIKHIHFEEPSIRTNVSQRQYKTKKKKIIYLPKATQKAKLLLRKSRDFIPTFTNQLIPSRVPSGTRFCIVREIYFGSSSKSKFFFCFVGFFGFSSSSSSSSSSPSSSSSSSSPSPSFSSSSLSASRNFR